MNNFTIFTKVGNNGQDVYAFELTTHEKVSKDDISLMNNYVDSSMEIFMLEKTNRLSVDSMQISFKDGVLHIDVEPFAYEAPFILNISGREYTKEDADGVKTLWADDFKPYKEGDVQYRLYEPAATAPRPLILFLHGGGEGGFDNWKQMVGAFGAAFLAESYPDCFVMAPQAHDRAPTPEEIEQFRKQAFETSNKAPDTGWCRKYLVKIFDIIYRLIEEGRVDSKRVYVTGYSMGGAGTIEALAAAPNLFTAGLPICPPMSPNTFKTLKNLTEAKIWITTAYIDHSLYRHKYIVDGIIALKDAGNKNAHVTLFSPEDLAEHGIGTIPEMPLAQRFGWNHASWVPTYHDSHGALSWMMTQVKN